MVSNNGVVVSQEAVVVSEYEPGMNQTQSGNLRPFTSEKEIEQKLAATVEPPDGGWGWVVVFSSFMIHVIIDGLTYSMGILFVALLEDFDSNKGETAWIVSIFVGITLMTGPIASGLVNLYGCRVVTMLGGFFGAVGFVISHWAPGIWFLYLSIGVIGGFGFGLIYLPAIVVVSYYFEKRRALATGLACCGSGLGTFVVAPLLNLLINEYGWKQTCFWMGGLILQCLVFGALFRPLPVIDNTEDLLKEQQEAEEKLKHLSKSEGHVGASKSPARAGSSHRSQSKLTSLSSLKDEGVQGHQLKIHVPLHRRDVFYSGSLQNIPMYQQNRSDYITSNMSIAHSLHQVKTTSTSAAPADRSGEKSYCSPQFTAALKETIDFSLLRDWCFNLFLVSNLFTNLGFNAPFLFIPDRAIEMGIHKEEAAFLLSIVGIANTIGRVLFGYIADLKIFLPRRLYVYASGLMVAGLSTCFSMAASHAAQAIYSAVFGVFIGCYVSLTAIVLVDLLGVEKLTSSFGMTLLVQGVSVLIGPPICGALYDSLKSYTWPFIVTGFSIALSGFLLFFIPCLARLQKKRTSTQQQAMGARIGVDDTPKNKDEEQTLQ